RRTRFDHVNEYLGCGVARAEAPDCLEPRQRRAGYAHASGNRAPDALELSDRAHVLLAVVPHALLHGRCKPLPLPQYGGKIGVLPFAGELGGTGTLAWPRPGVPRYPANSPKLTIVSLIHPPRNSHNEQ